MPEHDAEKCEAVFGRPSCSKLLELITLAILDEPRPKSSWSVRRAYSMGRPVRSKKMAASAFLNVPHANWTYPAENGPHRSWQIAFSG
jgi:hypothetical protein